MSKEGSSEIATKMNKDYSIVLKIWKVEQLLWCCSLPVGVVRLVARFWL